MRRQALFSEDPYYNSGEYDAPYSSTSERYILLAGEGGSSPVKLSQSDAQRIEEHTGYPPADLEDFDLKQSMQELNIHSAPLTDGDYRNLGIEPGSHQTGGETVIRQRSAPQPSLEEQLSCMA